MILDRKQQLRGVFWVTAPGVVMIIMLVFSGWITGFLRPAGANSHPLDALATTYLFFVLVIPSVSIIAQASFFSTILRKEQARTVATLFFGGLTFQYLIMTIVASVRAIGLRTFMLGELSSQLVGFWLALSIVWFVPTFIAQGIFLVSATSFSRLEKLSINQVMRYSILVPFGLGLLILAGFLSIF